MIGIGKNRQYLVNPAPQGRDEQGAIAVVTPQGRHPPGIQNLDALGG